VKSSNLKQDSRNFNRLANVNLYVLEIFLVVFEGKMLVRQISKFEALLRIKN